MTLWDDAPRATPPIRCAAVPPGLRNPRVASGSVLRPRHERKGRPDGADCDPPLATPLVADAADLVAAEAHVALQMMTALVITAVCGAVLGVLAAAGALAAIAMGMIERGFSGTDTSNNSMPAGCCPVFRH